MSKKVVLSMLDRATAVDLLPKTGNLEKIKKVKGWIGELEMTPEEKDIETSFNQIRDKEEKAKAVNDWYRTTKEIELSDELYDHIKNELEALNQAESISVTDNMTIYEAFDVK